ncbi:uncharacterized protein LOC115315900 [Ixodes scapularis]|uniref:uncharacterized protein LOC115315900 n=1 Tax=Ixodes scapularis TaxID=6945 RepID=UPI001A9FD321|nr:uncharacterized protein LOC115315900 [Ixodes scapularis]
MFALVRFLKEFDQKGYVVPVRCIKDFHPVNENDFDKNGVYTTFWEDNENSENTGSYPSQVLLLANSEEELQAKRASRRVRKAVIHPSDLETGEGSEHEASASQKQTSKQDCRNYLQEKKRQKVHQLASKSSAYQSILQEHLENSRKKNEAACAVRVSTKRRRPATESDSDSDDYVVSASELKRARSEARYWRHRCEEAIKEKAQLTNIIESMNGTIASKLTAIEEKLESRRPIQLPEVQAVRPDSQQEDPWIPRLNSGCIPHQHVPETSVQRARATPPNLPASLARGPPEVPNTEQLDSPPRDPPSILPTDDQPKSFQRATSGSPSATVDDPQAAGHAPFTDVGGGRFHLKRGLTVGSKQAKKALGQTKPALVAKDISQAIWGRQGLSERTYGGKLAPKDYYKSGATARKEMTPEKVALVIETVTYWGSRTGISVTHALKNMSTILSQKIQDVRKSMRRLDM